MKLTYTCHICKIERPDVFISVLTKQIEGMPKGTEQNIRYCNDNPGCIEGAKTFSFFNTEA